MTLVPNETEQALNRQHATFVAAIDEFRQKITEQAQEIERLRAALREITELPGEINHSNYNHDDVVALNNSFCEAFHIARAALGGENEK